MYNREIQESRRSPVENGMPLQGTWTRAFEEVDLLDVHRPYPMPLPKKIINSRIKEWESFIIQDDRFLLHARLCNFKYYRTALLLMYDRQTQKKLEYKKIIPGGGWRVPRFLNNDSVDSRSLGFFFRIHSWLDAGSIMLELNVKKKLRNPAFTAHAAFNFAGGGAPMAVSLLFSERRNMYACKVLTAVEGDVVSGGQHIHFDPARTSGLFCDFKGYYPYRMRCTWCTALGFDDKNRRFGFSLGENQARDPLKNNENALWVDGCLTPLPPVKITRNGGPESDWIIQDMEGMVDLVFSPKEDGHVSWNCLFSTSDYESPLGVFNGFLLTAEAQEMPIRNVWGTCEKLYLRV